MLLLLSADWDPTLHGGAAPTYGQLNRENNTLLSPFACLEGQVRSFRPAETRQLFTPTLSWVLTHELIPLPVSATATMFIHKNSLTVLGSVPSLASGHKIAPAVARVDTVVIDKGPDTVVPTVKLQSLRGTALSVAPYTMNIRPSVSSTAIRTQWRVCAIPQENGN